MTPPAALSDEEMVVGIAKELLAAAGQFWSEDDDWYLDGLHDVRDMARAILPIIRAAVEREREECALIADDWRKPSVALMRAGEMTAQELRTVTAVATAIASSIRSRT